MNHLENQNQEQKLKGLKWKYPFCVPESKNQINEWARVNLISHEKGLDNDNGSNNNGNT